ncbi:hypothetical protein ACIREM_23120 [Streptomyces shenzhenensis]
MRDVAPEELTEAWGRIWNGPRHKLERIDAHTSSPTASAST